MEINKRKIIIQGINKYEFYKLQKEFPDVEVKFENTSLQDDEYGELGTAATITLTIIGLKFLSAWLMKDRDRKIIKKSIEIIDSNGNRRIETIYIERTSSKAPASEVLEHLKSLFDID